MAVILPDEADVHHLAPQELEPLPAVWVPGAIAAALAGSVGAAPVDPHAGSSPRKRRDVPQTVDIATSQLAGGAPERGACNVFS